MSEASPPAQPSQTVDPDDAAAAATVTPHSLHSAVYARRAEYVRPHRVRVKVGTWNVAACPGTDQDVASWFVDGKGIDRRLASVAGGRHGALEQDVSNADDEETTTAAAAAAQSETVRVVGNDKVGLYVLGLQEVVDLKLASQYMSRVYAADPAAAVIDKWRANIEAALPAGYQLIASEHMSGLLLLVYASPEMAALVSHTSTSAVGTGLLGMLGNKGAVSASIVLGEATRMVFVNSHLSSGSEPAHAERRCWDVGQIESRTQFAPYIHPGVPRRGAADTGTDTTEVPPPPDKIDDADFAFWFGDLNFRLEGLPGDDIRRILTLHTRGEYDLSRPWGGAAGEGHAGSDDDNGGDSRHRGTDDDPLAGEEAVILKSPASTAASSENNNNRASWASATTATRTSMDTVGTVGTVDTAATALTDADADADDDNSDVQGAGAVDRMKELPPLPPRPDGLHHDDRHDDDDNDDDNDDDGFEPLPDPDDFVPDASEDPASLQATLDSLLPHDQLRRMIKERRAFAEGWREGRITFLPSYKYDIGTVGLFDSSEKQRAPSWCDRILFRTRHDKAKHDQRMRDEAEARRRDEEMKARGLDRAGDDDDDILFEYQPDESEFPHHVTGGSSASGGGGSFEYDEDGDAADSSAAAGPAAAYEPYDEDEDDNAAAGADTGDGIHQDLYTSHQRIQSSDHKPVVSLFTVDFEAAVPELKAVVVAEVAKQLDRSENESRPGITIVVDRRTRDATEAEAAADDDAAAVDLGALTFLQRATASLTIANTGRVPAVFSFVEKPSTEDLGASGSLVHAPSYVWLKTTFEEEDGGPGKHDSDGNADNDKGKNTDANEVVLFPGETVTALLEAVVDDIAFARRLNEGTSALDEVLVLRVMDGRDHFVPVHATWSATCIGRSVEELVRVPDGGIRKFLQRGSIPYELDVKHAAPKELFKLTEAMENLTDRAIADEQMLDDYKIPSTDAAPGWPFESTTTSLASSSSSPLIQSHIVAVIDALDTDRPVADAFAPEVLSLVRLEIVSHVLLLFLRALADGVVTIPLWSRISQTPLAATPSSSNYFMAAAAAAASPAFKDAVEADRNAVLDVLSSAPHHNILFVFLTATLARMVGELSPLSLGDVDALRALSRTTNSSGMTSPVAASGGFAAALGGLGRAFRKTSISSSGDGGGASAAVGSGISTASTAALAALERRIARERRYAEIFGSVLCRASPSLTSKDKDRKAQEAKQRAVVELFLRRPRDELL